MKDQFGRNINYMRISITDNCNLRCKYCMPNSFKEKKENEFISYEEIIRICNIVAQLGISKFKITGGEPLIRKGCASFIKELKALPCTEEVTLTTNGILLNRNIEELCKARIDAINVSLDTLNFDLYRLITGKSEANLSDVKKSIVALRKKEKRVKINAVILEHTLQEVEDLIRFANRYGVDLRFIELMPIGHAMEYKLVKSSVLLEKIKEKHPNLHAINERCGNGPATYFEADDICCKIGIIDAVSNCFCNNCNRIRLTSQGEIKPCLAYKEGINLKNLIDKGASDLELKAVIEGIIYKKPPTHKFSEGQINETRIMSQIGG